MQRQYVNHKMCVLVQTSKMLEVKMVDASHGTNDKWIRLISLAYRFHCKMLKTMLIFGKQAKLVWCQRWMKTSEKKTHSYNIVLIMHQLFSRFKLCIPHSLEIPLKWIHVVTTCFNFKYGFSRGNKKSGKKKPMQTEVAKWHVED